MVRANMLTQSTPHDTGGGLLCLADRTGDSARLAEVLAGVLAIARSGLEGPLRDALSECERQLVRLAERATIHEQNVYFDSVRALKQRRGEVMPRFFAWVEDTLARLGQSEAGSAPADRHAPKYTLTLSDELQLDEPTVLADIATKIEARIREPLYALGQRLAVLAGSPRIVAERLPLGPRCCTDAMRYAAEPLPLPLQHRLVLYRCFERVLMQPIGGFYAALNQHLIEHRILPALHSLAAAPETTARPPQRLQPTREAEAPKPLPTLRVVPGPAAPARPADVDEFSRLRELLGACRRAERYQVSSSALQDVLAGMQSRRAAGAANEPAGVLNGDRLRSEIFAALAERSTAGHIAHLEDADSDTIDLSAMLFEALGRHTRPDGLAAWVLSKVQIPVLRLALRDKAFFAVGAHPARQALSELVDLARIWVDEAGAEHDAALVEDIKRLALKLAYEYRDDTIVYMQALDEINLHAQRLTQRAALTEKRQVEAASGHDKLERARLAAQAAVAAALARHNPGDFAAMLLQRGWSDVLAVTLLREGDASATYARRLRALDAICGAPRADDADFNLREELNEGLALIGLHESDVNAVVRTLVGGEATDEEEPISQTALAIKLKSKPRLGGGDEAAPTADLPLSATEQRAYDELLALAPGRWFEFDGAADGEGQRRKLAWFSNATGRCLLLNARGQLGENLTLRELASRIAAGNVRALAADDGSFVDRAWNAIVQMLKTFSAGPQRGTALPTALAQTAAANDRDLEPQQAGTRTLLLVDDEVNVQRALIRVLRSEGYRILTASSATEGLDVLRENVVQVIVSDQRMPGMSGTEFLSKVKATHPNTIRLLLSGFSDAAAITEAINRGAIYKFLTKPWDDTDFRHQVSEAFKACAPR